MTDPCEKECNEYNNALKEELAAKQMVDTPLNPLGINTPPPSNLNAIDYWRQREKITEEKRKALKDCKKRNNKEL